MAVIGTVFETALTLAAAPASAQAGEAARWRARAAAATITRDDWGVAHVRGRDDADAVFAMIYAQAEDDYPRIEANYLAALGRRAEAEGEGALWADLRQRLFTDPAGLRAAHARAPGWLRALTLAWADALNCWLTRHPGPDRTIARYEPWMALAFSEGSIGGDVERVALPGIAAFYGGTGTAPAAVALADAGAWREPSGSNGVAVAPARTADGRTLLLINPHTSFFFRAEQQVTSVRGHGGGLDAYGAATWGQFFLYQGWNRHAGWMHTTSGVDSVDEFAEVVDRRGGRLMYRYGAGWRPVTVNSVTLAVRGPDGALGQRRFTTYATRRGPIVRAEGGRWIALALMNRPVAALAQSFLRTKATSLAAFQRVARLQANSTNNTIFADDRGTIAFLPPQFVPRRDDRFDYTRPVDGSDPATGWRGVLPPDRLPQVVAPATGWVRNTNDQPWSVAGAASPRASDYPRYLDQVGENPRGLHATALLAGAAPLTLAGLVAAAFDPALPAFDPLVPALAASWDALPAADPRRARLAPPVALLRGWDRRWAADSTATTLAVTWGEALWRATAGTPAVGLARYAAMAAPAAGAARLAALDAAVAQLTSDWGDWQIAWGRVNRFQRLSGAIRPAFDDAGPSVAVPFTSAQWGSLASFGTVTPPGLKRRYGTSGNSFVAAVAFGGPRVEALAVTAGGESGDPASPHFTDQAARYAGGQLRPVYLYPDELAAHTARVYRPGE